MRTGKDRRRFHRVPTQFPLRYRLIPVDETGYLEAHVEDLSPEGVKFRAGSGIRARAGLLLEMLVPGAEPVRVFGRATWVREAPGDGGSEVGTRFVDQSTATRKAILRHIEREVIPAEA